MYGYLIALEYGYILPQPQVNDDGYDLYEYEVTDYDEHIDE